MKYIILVLSLMPFHISADESPFDTSISDLISKTTQTEDPHYLSRALARCSGLMSLMHNVFTRDVPGTDFSNLEDESFLLFNASFQIDSRKYKSRGGDPSKESKSIIERIGKEMNTHLKTYSKWFENNLLNQGEYFGSSPILQAEIKLCRQLAQEIKSK